MNYRLVQQMQEKAIPAIHICRVLEVSRSGFYAAQGRWQRPAKICSTSVHPKVAFVASGATYGSRRLQTSLEQQGIQAGRYGLKPVWKRKFVHTTDSKHDLPVAENILDRQFDPAQPNQAWVADITY